jgi:Putative zinc-finger
MTGAGRCGDVRLALGVYVLGAADPAERALVRMHLARCRDCQEELATLAGLPGLLRRVPAAEADKVFTAEAGQDSHADPLSASTLPRLLGRAARTRRTRRWLAVAAMAVAVVLAAGSGIAAGDGFAADRVQSAPGSSIVGQTAWKTVSARNDLTRVTAAVRYTPVAWGTELEVRVSGIAPGIACQLRVTGPGEQRRIAAGWAIVPGQSGLWIPASTSFPASGIRAFAVVAGRKTLVTVPVSPG